MAITSPSEVTRLIPVKPEGVGLCYTSAKEPSEQRLREVSLDGDKGAPNP